MKRRIIAIILAMVFVLGSTGNLWADEIDADLISVEEIVEAATEEVAVAETETEPVEEIIEIVEEPTVEETTVEEAVVEIISEIDTEEATEETTSAEIVEIKVEETTEATEEIVEEETASLLNDEGVLEIPFTGYRDKKK